MRKDGDKTLETSLLGANRTYNGNFSVKHSGLVAREKHPCLTKKLRDELQMCLGNLCYLKINSYLKTTTCNILKM